ncbi:MAG: S8 family serine peptidase, partial [Bdellovibrionia bacterium]
MRSLSTILLSLVFIACSAPKNEDSGSSTGPVSCSSSTASVHSVQSKALPNAALHHGKLRLDLTATKLQNTTGIGGLLVDFKSQALTAPDQVAIPAGSRLVAVVDHACTRSKGYRARAGRGLYFSERIMDLRAETFQNDSYADKVHSHGITVERDTTIADLERVANSDECLTMLSSNVVFKPFITYPPNDTQLANQTHLPAIKWPQAYNKFFDNPAISQTVVIAIIDSGVDISHVDLSANVWDNTGENAVANGLDDDTNGYIDDRNGYNFASDIASPNPQSWPYPSTGAEGHGTHVAGLAAARQANNAGVSGVFGTSSVKIMALNVFGSSPSADTAIIDEAIRYAKNNGADVINLS